MRTAQDPQNHKIWTVYVHTNKLSKKRYVGITSLDVQNRWRDGNGYKNQVFGRAVTKYGWDNFKHEILFTNLDDQEAHDIERELISKWKTNDSEFGYNVTEGGEGTRGFVFSDESRQKNV